LRDRSGYERIGDGWLIVEHHSVAARAQTGKATLYRYWPSKIELLIDAAESSLSHIDIPDDDGDLRGQLLAVMRQIASDLGSPTSVAVRHLIVEFVRTPD
jgi:AcrR family transcriptional regulator